MTTDPVEEQYEYCYPPRLEKGERGPRSPLAQMLIERRREQMTLDALGDLVGYLRVAREERKALLVVTEGWKLFRPSSGVVTSRDPADLGLPPIGFGPRAVWEPGLRIG